MIDKQVGSDLPAKQLAERRAKRFWVSLVVMLLGIQLVIGGVAFHLATGDRTVAVVPNYHQAALHWDETKSARTAAQRNGWILELTVSDVADGRGMRAVELQVHHSEPLACDELRVSAIIYHHALALEVQSIDFRSVGNGRYLAMSPMGRAGLWQINLSIEGAEELMTLAEVVEVGDAG